MILVHIFVLGAIMQLEWGISDNVSIVSWNLYDWFVLSELWYHQKYIHNVNKNFFSKKSPLILNYAIWTHHYLPTICSQLLYASFYISNLWNTSSMGDLKHLNKFYYCIWRACYIHVNISWRMCKCQAIC